LVKRQGNSVFKTSPEHAAVMITEAVVNDPGSYPDCGRYLGDLFGASDRSAKLPQDQPKAKSSSSGSYSNTYGDQRYSY
ncbi:MAG: penicillin amidase, partial [Synechococcaceae bacterium WB9_4xC_028]|nr:penicillin amidase [Synechococcaceae bacterium WB9_4xC_028]